LLNLYRFTHIKVNEYYSLEKKCLLCVLLFFTLIDIRLDHREKSSDTIMANTLSAYVKRIFPTEFDDEQFEDEQVDELPEEMYQDEYDE